MTQQQIPSKILKILRSIEAKRSKTVIEHIIKHGYITTEELKGQYGYNHPPRAARDVREQGIPLDTFKVKDASGRSIAAYRFGKWENFRADRLKGRKAFPKEFKKRLVANYGNKCQICSLDAGEQYLQIDHRIPYEVVGDQNSLALERQIEEYMLLCSSCNRAKSWSCEHCDNWHQGHNPEICLNCYWASPESYTHISLNEIRRLDVIWQKNDIAQYEKIKKASNQAKTEMPEFVKAILQRALESKK